MFTGRIRMRVPGIFAPSESEDALVGLDRHHELVRAHPERALLLEGEVGDGAQRHRDLGDLAREALAVRR